MRALDVQVEVGSKRVFATVLAWPGWSRSAKDEAGALEALLDYGSRYKRAIGAAGRTLTLPTTERGLAVVEVGTGSASTDFGVPSLPAPGDDDPLTSSEMKRLIAVLRASWRAFDRAAARAGETPLRTGPRGGGRTLSKMEAHVEESDEAYLRALGGAPTGAGLRADFLDAVAARERGEIPDRGPRGGARWTPRYAIRRSAWHALDHAWEIEDRS